MIDMHTSLNVFVLFTRYISIIQSKTFICQREYLKECKKNVQESSIYGVGRKSIQSKRGKRESDIGNDGERPIGYSLSIKKMEQGNIGKNACSKSHIERA
jgi:hypothetical protein